MLKSSSIGVALFILGLAMPRANAMPRNEHATATGTTQKTAAPASKSTKPNVQYAKLSNIVQAVELVVDAYNSRDDVTGKNGTPKTMPPLKTADFDFKAVVDVKGGPSINFWIIKMGYTHEKQTTNDVTFEYTPKTLKPGGHFARPEGLSLKDALSKAIDQAANEIKGEKASDTSPLPLQFKSLAVTIAFQVTNDYQGGLNIPIHLVTLGLSGDVNSAATQSVKLTFSFPDDANKSEAANGN